MSFAKAALSAMKPLARIAVATIAAVLQADLWARRLGRYWRGSLRQDGEIVIRRTTKRDVALSNFYEVNFMPIIDVQELLKNAHESDGRVIADDTKKLNNALAKRQLCDKCDGTGNEFFFMYRRCEKCGGKGFIEQGSF